MPVVPGEPPHQVLVGAAAVEDAGTLPGVDAAVARRHPAHPVPEGRGPGRGPEDQQPPALGLVPEVGREDRDQLPPELVIGTDHVGLVAMGVPQHAPDPDRKTEPPVGARLERADGPDPLVAVGDGQAAQLGGLGHEVVHIGDAGFERDEAGPRRHFRAEPVPVGRQLLEPGGAAEFGDFPDGC